MLRKLIYIVIIILPLQGYSQLDKYLQKDPEPTNLRQAGIAFSILETGTAVGGFYDWPLGGFFHVGGTLNVFFLRDKKEYQVGYPDGYVGTYNKQNNVYLFDLMVTLKKRLLPRTIDDSFQPYIAVSAGPVYGMNFPEAPEAKDEFDLTFSAAAAVGVNAVVDNVYIFGARVQYRYMKFNDMLGEYQNHSMIDLRIELGKRF